MKKMILLVLPFAAACSSAPKVDGSRVDLANIGKEEVIQTYGKDDSLKSADPFVVQDGIVMATSMVTVPTDNRPESAIRMAQMRGLSTLATTIERRIESATQLANESGSGDTTQLRELIAESANLVANELKPGHVYYEKVRIIGDNGVARTEYRAWAEMIADEASFRRHIIDAIRAREGKASMSAQMSAAVDRQWSKITSQDDANLRKPSNDSKGE